MELDRQYGRESLSNVLAGDGYLLFGSDAFLLEVGVQRPCQRSAEAGEMGATITLRDVIGVAVNVLLVGVIPLHRQFDGDVVLGTADLDDRRMQGRLGLVQMLNEGGDAALIFEQVTLVRSLVGQSYAQP